MKFTKYHKYGAYHWKWYNNPKKYKRYRPHVNKIVNWVKEKNVLDIGAGDGLITHHVKAIGIDNCEKAIQLAKKKGVNIILADVYDIPYKDKEFDSALMIDVLEHLEFPEKALKEVSRVIKKYLYIAVPNNDIGDEEFHYRKFDKDELKNFVESQGFQLEGKIDMEYNKIYAKFIKK